MKEKQTLPIAKAKEEVDKWLDSKNYPQSKRETNEDQIQELAEAISEGTLVVLDDNKLEHKLLNPIKVDGVETVSSLTYLSRLNWSIVEPNMKGIKPADSFGIINAHIRALTGKAKGIITHLDSVDLSLARSIATFFL